MAKKPKKIERPGPSELVSIEMKCGACNATNKVNATINIGDRYICGGCRRSGDPDYGPYTCMCEDGTKTIEAACPTCNYPMVVNIV